ncbi:MAG: flagellar basal body L-ring protein FlgH [Arenimonas sp.]
MKTKLFFQAIALLSSALVTGQSFAQSSQSLIDTTSFRGPAADQRAYRVGDVLTVYVLETTRARSQAATDSDRSTGFAADLSAPSTSYNGSLVLQGKTKGAAQTTRVGELRAQLTVRVEAIEANGLMRIKGTQVLEVNKEQQRITLSGLVRPEDISSGNIIWSTRIADAQVSLAGKGIVSEAQRKSLLARVASWLGLL